MNNILVNFRPLSFVPIVFFLISFCLMIGCQKQILVEDSRLQDLHTVSSAQINTDSPFYFDWENATHVPTPQGVEISMPWHSSGERKFENSFNDDFAKTDGWELLMNTFTVNQLPVNPYFALYNKYRGVVRIFTYASQASAIPSEHIVFSLGYDSTLPIKIYTYHTGDVIDFNNARSSVTQALPFQIFQTATWYGAEFELSYDPVVNNLNGQLNRINWNIVSRDFSTITLGGSARGEINGVITQPNTSANFLTDFIGGGVKAALNLKTFGATNLLERLITNPQIRSGVQTGLEEASQGFVKNFFNGIIGSKGTNESTVDLKVNLNIEMNGLITGSPRPVTGGTISIPGSNMSNVLPANVPLYNYPLGVFSISAKPKVTLTRFNEMLRYPNGSMPFTGHKSSVNVTFHSDSYQFFPNPALQADAEITLVKTELIILNSDFFYRNWPNLLNPNHSIENVGDQVVVNTNTPGGVFPNLDYLNVPDFLSRFGNNSIAVRLTLEVKPYSGIKPTKIVKTFLCDVIDGGEHNNYININFPDSGGGGFF